MERHHEDVAASVQVLVEEALLHVARHLQSLTGARHLCLAGGVALNSVANGRLRREGPFDDLFVPPVPGDCGTSIGTALHVWHQHLGRGRSWRFTDPFLGPRFDPARCLEAARHSGLPHGVDPDVAASVARRLAEGEVVGWFTGGVEMGPRALGHRSILAAPREAAMRDRVNHKVKHREPFRPFAPAVLEEKAPAWFENPAPCPFMTEVHAVRPERRADLGAVTHVDGTARLQTVDASRPGIAPGD